MDALLQTLINAGGLGILAAVLLFLHLQNVRMFREEMGALRTLFKDEIKAERAQCREEHLEFSAKMDRCYAAIDNLRAGRHRGGQP